MTHHRKLITLSAKWRNAIRTAPRTAALLASTTLAALLMGCSDGGGSNAVAPASVGPQVDDDPYPVRMLDTSDIEDQVIVEDDVPIVVTDGTTLSARVFRPDSEGQYPIIMSFTSYGKDKGPDGYPPVLDNSENPDFDMGTFTVSNWTTWEGPDPAYWVPKGYAVMYVDVRGYYDSEGEASILSEQDRMDFHDVIEWAGTRDWSNGSVGLTGVSYLAISQWVAAGDSPPPYLKAIMPWEGQTDAYREVLYHGGVPETAFTQFWVGRVNSGANTPPLPPVQDFQRIHKSPPLMKRILSESPQVAQPEMVTVPALICATWSDQGLHTRGSFEAFKHASSPQKWLYTHGRQKWAVYYSDEALELQERFFDHFLKGASNGMDDLQPVRLEVRESLDSYEVRYENEWPIARTQYQTLYLDAALGELNQSPPEQAAAADYDPGYGGATFNLVFDQDTEITGNMKLKLWVSASEGEDMDLFVGVKKLDVRGEEVNFYAKTGYTLGPAAMGWLRVSERELDQEKSTPWQPVLTHENPQPITANEIVSVEIEILPSSTLFRAGESLQLVIQGADLFEHPLMAHEYASEVNLGTHSIHTGEQYDSHLLMPVIP